MKFSGQVEYTDNRDFISTKFWEIRKILYNPLADLISLYHFIEYAMDMRPVVKIL